MKLLCIDGNSIINRAFYGIKLLTTKDGRFTNGVYGFINILNRLCEMEQPDGVAVAFDLRAPTFRHKMYDAYKAGRRKMPEELASQFPILKEWLNLAGYTCVECEGYEADDILGTLARQCEERNFSCVIATGDRDSLQLISEHTRVLLAATKMGKPEIVTYDRQVLFERYGLTPEEMIELKALMGDSSDHIPGVAGVGEKTALDLIARYHSVEYIYKHLDSIEVKESVRAKLTAGRESAQLSWELGTICRTAPIAVTPEQCRKREANQAELARLMTSLEFFKLMEKMGLQPDASSAPARREEAVRSIVCVPYSEMGAFSRADLYFENGKAAVLAQDRVAELSVAEAARLLADESVQKRVYDYKSICKRFEPKSVVFDAMLAGYLCNPSSSSYSLERLAQEYGAAAPTLVGDAGETVRGVCLLSEVCNRLESALEDSGQSALLQEIELPLARVLAGMETVGFAVDRAGLEEMGEDLSERIAGFEREIYDAVGYAFNLNSPKQLGVALFEKLGLPAKKKTKSGYSTNAEVLEELRYAHPVVELLLRYRTLSKLKSTYCDGLLSCIGEDGRIHSTFNQTEARTGRISSLEPNLQNIPVKTEEGRKLRKFFKAAPGCVLCDADYSQIELRVLAAVSGDANMTRAFEEGVDIHTLTAAQVFGMPDEMITPLLRSRAKAVNFGIVYGIGAFSLSKDIGVSRKEADAYIKGYFATYPKVAEYMEKTVESAKRNGYVTTEFGRRRYLPELSSSQAPLRAFGERAARNAPIQGTAADIIKIAMVRVFERLEREVPSARLILQVHDELIVECEEKDAQRVCELLQEEMESAVSLSVPMRAEAHFGENWLEAKG